VRGVTGDEGWLLHTQAGGVEVPGGHEGTGDLLGGSVPQALGGLPRIEQVVDRVDRQAKREEEEQKGEAERSGPSPPPWQSPRGEGRQEEDPNGERRRELSVRGWLRYWACKVRSGGSKRDVLTWRGSR
jgi:hypothetical protein